MISFIVPAYNEALQIGEVVRCIRRSAAQSAIPCEIIVVNDGSEDDTESIARASGAQVINVHKRQIAAVRNAGAQAATGEILAFVDGDSFLHPDTLAAALDTLEQGAIGGGALCRFDHAGLFAHCMMWLCARGLRLFGLCGGCFLFATREAFDRVGGFDEELFASEEVSFARAMHRVGRFVVVRQPVTTSGRKVRRYSVLRLLGLLARISLKGRKGVRRREGLDIWYDGVRESPTGSISPAGPLSTQARVE